MKASSPPAAIAHTGDEEVPPMTLSSCEPSAAARCLVGTRTLFASVATAHDYIVNPAGAGACDLPGDNFARMRLDLRDASMGRDRLYLSWHFLGTFPTDALPMSADSIRHVSLDFTVLAPGASSGAIPIGRGDITSVISTVPEPGALLLGLMALVGCSADGGELGWLRLTPAP